jgi:hypothetical protein
VPSFTRSGVLIVKNPNSNNNKKNKIGDSTKTRETIKRLKEAFVKRNEPRIGKELDEFRDWQGAMFRHMWSFFPQVPRTLKDKIPLNDELMSWCRFAEARKWSDLIYSSISRLCEQLYPARVDVNVSLFFIDGAHKTLLFPTFAKPITTPLANL